MKNMIVCLSAAAVVAMFSGQARAADYVCANHPNGGALDFWVGDWRVTSSDGETLYGKNKVEKALDGCAIFEHWRSERGGEGKSLFYFDARDGAWTQIWVTTDTSRPGGLKRKILQDDYSGPGVRFQGDYPGNDGKTIFDRTTLTPEENGVVRQHIEISTDAGETWRTTFDAAYIPTSNN